MSVVYEAGNCNQNSNDYRCWCYSSDSSQDSKIYDNATGEYVCCGTFDLLATSTSPSPLDGKDKSVNTLYNFALKDDPRCMGWWNGSANNFATLGLTNLPVPGSDFYLPDASPLVNGLMPASWGPSDTDKNIANTQSLINEVISLPVVTIEGETTVASCTQSSSKPNNKIYWMRYLNPNNRQTDYVETMVCADLDQVKSSAANLNSDFALFDAQCYSTVVSGVYKCTSDYGPVTDFRNTELGNVIFSSVKYGGGNGPTPVPEKKTKPIYEEWWFWFIIGMSVVVLAVIITLIVVYQKNKAKKIESNM